MSTTAALAAACGAGALASAALRATHPRRSPQRRMELPLEAARVQLGGSPAPAQGALVAGEALRRGLPAGLPALAGGDAACPGRTRCYCREGRLRSCVLPGWPGGWRPAPSGAGEGEDQAPARAHA